MLCRLSASRAFRLGAVAIELSLSGAYDLTLLVLQQALILRVGMSRLCASWYSRQKDGRKRMMCVALSDVYRGCGGADAEVSEVMRYVIEKRSVAD